MRAEGDGEDVRFRVRRGKLEFDNSLWCKSDIFFNKGSNEGLNGIGKQ